MKPVFDFQSLPRFDKVAPPLRKFPARDGAHLSYRFYDSEAKDRVFILLHGSSAHGIYLHALAEFLSQEAKLGQVYVPNLRGHYGSGEARGDCDYVGQLEDDLYDLIDYFHLQNKKMTLIGHSSGGGFAIRVGGGPYGHLIDQFILLSPAIPTSPTMRNGNGGGWAQFSLWKIIGLSILNQMGITSWNHARVISFNRPPEFRGGSETLSYSYNLNTSYHPRLPYQTDIKAIQGRFLVLIGRHDEANDPSQFPAVMHDPSGKSIRVMEKAKHLDIVYDREVMEEISKWIKADGNQTKMQ